MVCIVNLTPGGTADAADLERVLRSIGSRARAVSEKAYLKSDLEFAGVAMPAMRAATAAWYRDHGGLTHDRLVAMVRALWASPLYESHQSAALLLESNTRLLTFGDVDLVEYLLRHSGTWALTDPLAANVAGDLARRFIEMTPILDRWAADTDFWIRRSAMLALLGPLRRGEGDFERFARYADAMLEEKEFFIRKAIGWVLRETAKRRPELVATWLAPRLHRASGVTVREAVKPLPAPVRDLLLAGYRAKMPVRLPDLPGEFPSQLLPPGTRSTVSAIRRKSTALPGKDRNGRSQQGGHLGRVGEREVGLVFEFLARLGVPHGHADPEEIPVLPMAVTERREPLGVGDVVAEIPAAAQVSDRGAEYGALVDVDRRLQLGDHPAPLLGQAELLGLRGGPVLDLRLALGVLAVVQGDREFLVLDVNAGRKLLLGFPPHGADDRHPVLGPRICADGTFPG